MKARDLAGRQPSLPGDASVAQAARILADPQVEGLLVQDAAGHLLGVLSSAVLLRWLLPAYVQEDEQLAGVLDDRAAEVLFERVKNRRLEELLPSDPAVVPRVRGEDSLIEVASAMVRTGSRLVAVMDADQIVGGITLQTLLDHLVGHQ